MEKVYDSMVSVALINMFTLSKEENFINRIAAQDT